MEHTVYKIYDLTVIEKIQMYSCGIKRTSTSWKFQEIYNNVVRIYFDFPKTIITVEIDHSLDNHMEILRTVKQIFKEELTR